MPRDPGACRGVIPAPDAPRCACGHAKELHNTGVRRGVAVRTACSVHTGPACTPCGCQLYTPPEVTP